MDKKEKEQVANIAIKRYRRGDPLTDEEIQVTIDVLLPLAEALHRLGERYILAASDLTQTYYAFKAFQDSRKRL